MLHTNRFLGGMLLVAGTTIGGGMLVIPVMCSFTGFFPSLLLLLFVWAFMFLTSVLFLEVNLTISGDINMVTMAEVTLGKKGKAVAWIAYLLLLYSLLAAYIAGSKELFVDAVHLVLPNVAVPDWISPLPLLALFGVFIYLGTRTTDYVNRLLMLGLIVTFVCLAFFLPSHIDTNLLTHVHFSAILLAVPLVFTSFGFHIIIPSLVNYLHRDRKKLILILLYGSLIPLFIYVLWQFLILGSVPLYGEIGLVQAWVDGSSSFSPLLKLVNRPFVATASRLFATFALITSFLGVSLSLVSFLRDALHVKRTSSGRLILCLLTFIPPLLFVYFYQRGFVLALQYAAIFVMILLAIMPALMTWTLKKKFFWTTGLGKCVLSFVILVAIAVIATALLQEMGFLHRLVVSYLPIDHV